MKRLPTCFLTACKLASAVTRSLQSKAFTGPEVGCTSLLRPHWATNSGRARRPYALADNQELKVLRPHHLMRPKLCYVLHCATSAQENLVRWLALPLECFDCHPQERSAYEQNLVGRKTTALDEQTLGYTYTLVHIAWKCRLLNTVHLCDRNTGTKLCLMAGA